MKITHVTHRIWPVIGGSERYVMEIARRQAADGHTVTVVATDADDLAALWSMRGRRVVGAWSSYRDGVNIVRLPVRTLPLGSLTFPVLRRFTWSLSQLSPDLAMGLARFVPWIPDLKTTLMRTSTDLLIAWNLTLEGLSATVARVARQRQVPWIAVPLLHLAHPRFYTMPHQLTLLSMANHVVVQTDLERDYLLGSKKRYGFTRDAIAVAGPGVCKAEAKGADGQRFREKLGLARRPIVLSLGSLTYEKGSLHVLDAVRRLWRAGSRVNLILAGVPDAAMRRGVQRLPDPQRSLCHLLGRVSEQDKWDAIAAADVVVQPSRTESFGIVFLEAWILKKPVIGARAGAVPEVVTHQRDGLLVNFGDVVGLTDAIQTLIRSPELAADMGSRGCVKVVSNYTWHAQYERFKQVVRQTMAKQTILE